MQLKPFFHIQIQNPTICSVIVWMHGNDVKWKSIRIRAELTSLCFGGADVARIYIRTRDNAWNFNKINHVTNIFMYSHVTLEYYISTWLAPHTDPTVTSVNEYENCGRPETLFSLWMVIIMVQFDFFAWRWWRGGMVQKVGRFSQKVRQVSSLQLPFANIEFHLI